MKRLVFASFLAGALLVAVAAAARVAHNDRESRWLARLSPAAGTVRSASTPLRIKLHYTPRY